ncbi:hypothetical protein Q8G41_27770, partial [Klebsiella pneumoniae]|uniref:hypothetical protein n=1 Tax=Klebsiella pneumoniae TaxID=573 RepID=UPI003013572B
MARSLSGPQLAQTVPLRSGSSTRLQIPRILTLWHLASLDAPTVAVVWALSFAWAAGVHLTPWTPLLLASGTWSVYVG